MGTKSAKLHSGQFSFWSLLAPPLLLGGLAAFGAVKPPLPAEAQTMTVSESTAEAMRDSRFTRTWAITLRNQYHAANTYRQALCQPQTLDQRHSLEIRYTIAAREYNRMASEAPAAVFQTLPQPQSLPVP